MTELDKIRKNFPPLNQRKMEKRLRAIRRMAEFYQSKVEVAPYRQSVMFSDFHLALMYAESIIREYESLVKELEKCTDL